MILSWLKLARIKIFNLETTSGSALEFTLCAVKRGDAMIKIVVLILLVIALWVFYMAKKFSNPYKLTMVFG